MTRIATDMDDWGKKGFRTPHKVTNGKAFKYCSGHEIFEPIDEFGNLKRSWDGKESICKEYKSELRRKQYEETGR